MPVPVTTFPDRTSQVWNVPDAGLSLGVARIIWDFATEAEFLQLAQLRDLLRAYGNPIVHLHLRYLPYGRQDKRIHNNLTFALRTFAKLINNLDFDTVTCVDPHSEVAAELIRNFTPIYPVHDVRDVFTKVAAECICLPDRGAACKYGPLFPLYNLVMGSKERDQQTGKITSYYIVGDVKDRSVLIVDDICDGGATFILLAEKLYEGGARDVNLYVSHGIFSKGLKVLRDAKINRIFTKEGEMAYDARNFI